MLREAFAVMGGDGRGGRHQHRGHHELGDDSADGGVPAGGRQMLGTQLLIGHRRLLVEDHPRHDHRADIGGDEIHVVLVGEGNSHRLGGHGRQVRMGDPGDAEEGEFEQTHGDGRSLDPAIGAGHHDQEQGAGGQGQGDVTRQAIKLADAGDAGELGQQGAAGGDRQPCHRHPRPGSAEGLA